MDKKKQFDEFFEKLKKEKSVKYAFNIGWDWYTYHGRFEELNNDWIEGVSERYIDGDNAADFIVIKWEFDEKKNKIEVIMEYEYYKKAEDLEEHEDEDEYEYEDELEYVNRENCDTFFLDDEGGMEDLLFRFDLF